MYYNNEAYEPVTIPGMIPGIALSQASACLGRAGLGALHPAESRRMRCATSA